MKNRTLEALRNRVMTDQGAVTVSQELGVVQDALPQSAVAIPIDSAGAIGADAWAPGGQAELVQTGMATSIGGPGLALQTLRKKEDEATNVPPNFVEYPEISVTANSGVIKDVEVGFPIHTIIVDNMTNIWIYVDGAQHYVPPGTIGANLLAFAGPNKLRLTAAAPPGVAQPAISSPAGTVSVQCYEELLGYSAGSPSPISSVPITLAPPSTTSSMLAAASGTATQAVTDITGATVAAGDFFTGNVMITAAAENAPVTATGTLQVSVTWVPGTGGTTANPVAIIDLAIPATIATAVVGEFDSGQITVPVSVFAGSTAGKFRCTVTSTGTISAMKWDVIVNGFSQ